VNRQLSMGRFVRRIAGAGLSIAIWIAVLAFGGTSPPLFLLTQITILGLGVFVLFVSLRSPLTQVHFPWVAPVFLISLVLLQISPLPPILARLFGLWGDASAGRMRHTISVAPYQTLSHLLLLVTYLTAFYLVLLVCEDRTAKRQLIYSLVALGAFEAFYGLVQYLTGWQQIFAYVKKYYLEDATGTYINRNHFAGLLEMVLPFTVALAIRLAGNLRSTVQPGAIKARIFLSAKELFPLVLLLFLAVATFTALVFSRSRMGIISALASLITVLALAGSSSLSKRTRVVAATLFFLGVVGIVVWVGRDPVIVRFENLGQEYSQTAQNRLSIWRDTLNLIQQHPLFGTGLGTFSVAYTSVQTVFLNLLVDHAHCDYLEAASDLGLPGGVLLFGSIFWILAKAVGSYRKAEDRFEAGICLGCIGGIVAILVHSLADFNLYIPANALVFAVTLALAQCGAGSSRSAAEGSVSAGV
jgi:putative inorganic carbon (HCO3(-)) transporter